MYAQAAAVLGTPPPRLVHMPTDLLLEVAPKHGPILVENFQFNNIFDNAAARSDLGFGYTIPFTEGVRRVIGGLDARNGIQSSDEQTWYDDLVAAYTRIGNSLPRFHD